MDRRTKISVIEYNIKDWQDEINKCKDDILKLKDKIKNAREKKKIWESRRN